MTRKPLRDQLDLRPGDVEVVPAGTGPHIEPLAGEALEERSGRMVIPASGIIITDDDVRALRDTGQR